MRFTSIFNSAYLKKLRYLLKPILRLIYCVHRGVIFKFTANGSFYFLEKEFLEDYLGDWKRELNATPNLTRETRNRIMLSQQTLLRWKISG